MSRIGKNTLMFSTGTLISRFLGLLREFIFTYFLGASIATDIFFATFRIPNFLRQLLAEGTLSFAYINVSCEYKKKHGENESNKLSSAFLIWIALITTVLFFLILFYSEYFIKFLLPGFEQEKILLATYYLKWIFPFIIFISLSSIFSGYLNIKGNFFLPAFSPVFLNIFLISAVVFFYAENTREMGKIFGISVMLAGGVQLFLLGFSAFKNGFRFSFKPWHPGLKKMFFYFIPGTFAMAATQINMLVDNIFASYLPYGGISWVNYGNRLVQFPLGIFGVALATVMTPYFADNKNNENMGAGLIKAFRLNTVIMIPCTVFLYIYSYPVIKLLFERGKFSSEDSVQVAAVCALYSLGLWFYSTLKLLLPYFYSAGKMYIPFFGAVFGLVVNTLLNYYLMIKMGAAGLALATTFSALLKFCFFMFFVDRKGFGTLGLFFVKFSVLTGFYVLLLHFLKDFNLLFNIFAGCVIYVILLLLFKFEELGDIIEVIKMKMNMKQERRG